MFKDAFEEFLSLVEKSTGRSRTDLGFHPPASEAQIAAMEAALREDSDADEWDAKVGAHGLDDLKTMLRLANGHTTKFAFLNGPLLDTESVVREYGELLEYASDDDDGYEDDDKLRAVTMHPYWIPFASYPAEVSFLVDFDPGPAGKHGQVLVNYNFEEKFVVCDSLTDLFTRVNEKLKEGSVRFGPVQGYEQEYDLLDANGKRAKVVQLLS